MPRVVVTGAIGERTGSHAFTESDAAAPRAAYAGVRANFLRLTRLMRLMQHGVPPWHGFHRGGSANASSGLPTSSISACR